VRVSALLLTRNVRSDALLAEGSVTNERYKSRVLQSDLKGFSVLSLHWDKEHSSPLLIMAIKRDRQTLTNLHLAATVASGWGCQRSSSAPSWRAATVRAGYGGEGALLGHMVRQFWQAKHLKHSVLPHLQDSQTPVMSLCRISSSNSERLCLVSIISRGILPWSSLLSLSFFWLLYRLTLPQPWLHLTWRLSSFTLISREVGAVCPLSLSEQVGHVQGPKQKSGRFRIEFRMGLCRYCGSFFL
jgi:hypothetical protein